MEFQNPLKFIRILLISDDDDVIREIRWELRKHAVHDSLTVARDRLEVLEILSRQKVKSPVKIPPVILLDSGRDPENGYSLFDEVAWESKLSDSVIFVLSSPEDDYATDPRYGANVAGYVHKPPSGKNYSQLSQMLDYVIKTAKPATPTFKEPLCAISA